METQRILYSRLIAISPPPSAYYKYLSLNSANTYKLSRTARIARRVPDAAGARRFFMQYGKFADDS